MTESSHTYQLIYSKRRSLQLEVKPDQSLLVRAPVGMSRAEINRFLEQKSRWIERTQASLKARLAKVSSVEVLTESELGQLKLQARRLLIPMAERIARKLEVTYGRISIRAQRTKWGSCSSKGNLNFNCLLALAPPEIAEYVVAHELCHLVHLNHSNKFWQLLESVMPDYKLRKRWLREHELQLMAKLGTNR